MCYYTKKSNTLICRSAQVWQTRHNNYTFGYSSILALACLKHQRSGKRQGELMWTIFIRLVNVSLKNNPIVKNDGKKMKKENRSSLWGNSFGWLVNAYRRLVSCPRQWATASDLWQDGWQTGLNWQVDAVTNWHRLWNRWSVLELNDRLPLWPHSCTIIMLTHWP